MPHFECGAFNRSATSPHLYQVRRTYHGRAAHYKGVEECTGGLARLGFQTVRVRHEDDIETGVHMMDFSGDSARKGRQQI
jgi:hypothetical protein